MQKFQHKFYCDAILFDLDGVLVNSSQVIERQWRLWAARNQIDMQAIMAVWHGRRAFEIIQIVAPHLDTVTEAGLVAAAEAADRKGLQVYPGAQQLLTTLPANHWAIATSGPLAVASTRLGHAGLPFPQIFVTGDDVQRGKPSPDPYLLAAARLNVPAQRCVVIEDAPAGIEAGLAAGAQVIAIASTNPPKELNQASAVAAKLTDLRVTVHTTGAYRLTIEVATAV